MGRCSRRLPALSTSRSSKLTVRLIDKWRYGGRSPGLVATLKGLFTFIVYPRIFQEDPDDGTQG